MYMYIHYDPSIFELCVVFVVFLTVCSDIVDKTASFVARNGK